MMKKTDKDQTDDTQKQPVDQITESSDSEQKEESEKQDVTQSEETENPQGEEKNNSEQKSDQKPKSEKEKIADLEKENADLKDQLLRRAADFDNYRKRMIKEKQDAFDYANTSLLKDLLDSLDNFDRTVEAANTAKDAKSIADGVKMINKNLVNVLETKYNLVSYGGKGDLFDPDEHEAIGSEKGSVAEAVLKEVYLKGYKLKDKVIRHAKVMVTMPDGSVVAEESDKKDSNNDK